jgi:hypothetical protein
MSEESNPLRPDVAGTYPGPVRQAEVDARPTGAPPVRSDDRETEERAPDGHVTDGHVTNGHGAAAAREKVAAGAADLRHRVTEATTALGPHVVAATERTKEAAENAVGTVREKLGQHPRVATATERTLAAKDKAVGTVREQAEQHPEVAAAAERTVAAGGKVARSAGQQARSHPRATGGALAGGVLLLAVRRRLRRRHAKV